MPRRNSSTFALIAAALWGGVVLLGLIRLWSYDAAPGYAAQAAPSWPGGLPATGPRLAADGDTLVMLAHPRCPCTRASIDNLARIVAASNGRLRAYVLFYQPGTGADAAWRDTDLVRAAAAIPGVRTVADPGGALATRFHGYTSGQTLLYDPAGRLLFSGGLTAARGHCGDSVGSDAVLTRACGGDAAPRSAPVFGCSLTGAVPAGADATRSPQARARRATL